MHFFASLSTPVTQAMGWALLHSFWQAFILFICLRLVLLIYKNATSGVRYNLSAIALLGIFAWFVATFIRQLHLQQELVAMLPSLPASVSADEVIQMQYVLHQEHGLAVLMPQLENYFPLITALYLAGMLLCFLRSLRDYRELIRIRTRGLVAFDPAWEHYLDKLVKQLGIPGKVKLLVSEIVDVPLMAGYLKPMIYLPFAAINNLTPDQLEAILLHELSHIKRNDYLGNIIQTIVETILFFNPFVWWISKNIRKERENCCDDMVIATSNPLRYASALVALEEHRLNSNPLAMAAAGDQKQLLQRIKRMMEMKTSNLNFTQKLLAILVITGTIASVAWLAPQRHTPDAPVQKMAPFTSELLAPVAGGNLNILVRDTLPEPKKTDSVRIMEDHPEATEGARIVRDHLDIVDDSTADAKEELNLEMSLKDLPQELDSSFRNIDWAKQKLAIEQSLEEARRSIARIDWKKQQAEIDRSMARLKKQMSSADWAKQRKNMALAMENAKMAMDAAMKNIDWHAMNDNMKLSMMKADSAMKNIDWHAMNDNMKLSMRQADSAMRNINWNKINRDMHESMAKAKVEMDRARAQWKNNTMVVSNGRAIQTSRLINEMRADNLIRDDKNYDVKLNSKGLYINGRKQSKSTYEKYRDMVGDHTNLELTRHDGKQHTSIDVKTDEDK